jgi:hypothetical protein
MSLRVSRLGAVRCQAAPAGDLGRNLLDDAALAPGFDALLEYRGTKPFECVSEGTIARRCTR